MSERAKVKLIADGTVHGTHLLIDGKAVDCTLVRFEHDVESLPMVTVRLYLNELQVEGELLVEKEPTA